MANYKDLWSLLARPPEYQRAMVAAAEKRDATEAARRKALQEYWAGIEVGDTGTQSIPQPTGTNAANLAARLEAQRIEPRQSVPLASAMHEWSERPEETVWSALTEGLGRGITLKDWREMFDDVTTEKYENDWERSPARSTARFVGANLADPTNYLGGAVGKLALKIPGVKRATAGALKALAHPWRDTTGSLRGAEGLAGGGIVGKALKKYGPRAARGEIDTSVEGLPGQLGVIKQKGGNWLTGSVEDSLSGLKRDVPGVRSSENPRLEEVAKNAAINNFIDKQLTRYIKNEMATPEDPVRALAERGVLHTQDVEQFGRNFVHPSGEHYEKLAKNPLAQVWENASDNMLRVEPASTYQNFGSSNLGEEWINRLDPNTPFYRPKDNAAPINLGFSHLIDELRNALNPASGLPQELLLDPKSVERVSVPQAVERVAKINAWRVAQKAEADALRANNAATVLHKEYPDKGFKWVELKQPEAKTFEDLTPQQQEWYHDYLTEGVSPEGAVRNAAKRGTALQDALKYEGDTMGHCVGSYCDDVAGGRSRIYSLRDAKGEPHVTIETSPNSVDPTGSLGIPDSIRQIKGKGNRKPNDEYLPFVQDFVKSGKWSDVGDLHNTGLTRVPTESPLAKRLIQEKREVPSYMTDAEYEALTTEFGMPKYAGGGSVAPQLRPFTVSDLHAIIASLEAQAA